MRSKFLRFFSTAAGKEKIQNGSLSQLELFMYFYLITVFDYLGLTLQALDSIGSTHNFFDYLTIWEDLIVEVVGLIILFLANGGSKGRDFLSKYFVFSFTVGIKYSVPYAVLVLLSICYPILDSNHYTIPLYALIEILMVANIGLRIYQTKT